MKIYIKYETFFLPYWTKDWLFEKKKKKEEEEALPLDKGSD